MPLFKWSAEYSVGVNEFDEQHKKLMGMINELHSAMKSGRSKEAFEPLFDGLIDYTTKHFRAEEKLMQEHSYLSYTVHQKEHTQLIMQVLEFWEKYKQGNIGLGVELLTFLTKWLQHHIKGTDKQYGAFFNAKGIH